MVANYNTVKKILDIKSRKSEKALQEKNKVQKKLTLKEQEISQAKQKLEDYKNYISEESDRLWQSVVGKSAISIDSIDNVKRKIEHLHAKTITMKEDISHLQNQKKEIENELTEANNKYVALVYEEEKFKRTHEEFKIDHLRELLEKEESQETKDNE